jgi:3D (Asp-Asp-Asp) domain-containing protein/predicted  nucleic acid-binding Zn-ribbon protein
MQIFKRMILTMVTGVLCVSGSMAAHAQTNTETLNSVEQELEQKAQEKQAVTKEIENIQQEMESLYTYISANKEAMASTQKRIADTNQLIEQKKDEIVTIEDKILARQRVMKQRLVALQHDDNLSLVIKVIFESKSLDDFIQRASAVSALFSADKDILGAQEKDLKQIEADKKAIDQQEQVIEAEQKVLANQQAELDQNLQKRQESLTVLQEKYSQIGQQMALAEQEKAGIETQIKEAQEKVRREQEAAQARTAPGTPVNTTVEAGAGKGEEMYVSATAYTPEDCGSVTALGYNIKDNPNMKLIAVDPSVIPLGKKVWVEGYGVAVAGDTGGAIIGHKIDVLMPTKEAALSWGRKTVKIIVLD